MGLASEGGGAKKGALQLVWSRMDGSGVDSSVGPGVIVGFRVGDSVGFRGAARGGRGHYSWCGTGWMEVEWTVQVGPGP